MLRTMAGININHVAYKGGPPAVNDLTGGHVSLMFNSLPAVLPLVKAGRLRPLAVASAKRTPTLPELPTFAESGIPEFEAGSWYGVLAPAGTPRELIMRLHAETVQMLALPDIRQKLAAEGAEAIGNSPEEFAAQIRRDIERWEKVARAAKIPRQ
jgi:tripartite-type tricarboxylate transporter receptor subunit TctC